MSCVLPLPRIHIDLNVITAQRAPDCDMFLIHDDDLKLIGTVSGYLTSSYSVLIPRSAVAGSPSTRHGDGSPPEVQDRDTLGSVW
jgi:hypothetical protein